jgi:delta14-sterol reductase
MVMMNGSYSLCRFFFVRAGMMGWLLINLSILAKSVQDGSLSQSMILYQIFCALYILDYFVHEEYMTSTWDIIAERLGFMLVFGDLLWIPFTFSIQACNCEPEHKQDINLSY